MGRKKGRVEGRNGGGGGLAVTDDADGCLGGRRGEERSNNTLLPYFGRFLRYLYTFDSHIGKTRWLLLRLKLLLGYKFD